MTTVLAEPVTRVPRRWVALLVLANLAVWMGFFTPIQVLLPNQLDAIDHAHKETALGIVTALGAAAAVVFNPLAGALSDRTTSRFGRRHGWTVGGAILGAVALVLLAQQQTVLGVALAWIAAQACLNTMLASLTAAVPDRVPVEQRGAVSGWIGIPQILGVILGVILVTAIITGNASGYVAVAVLVVLLPLPFALLTPDERLLPQATDRAKDLGVINIANSAPQVLGPAISAPIVVHLGGYPVLYALTAVVTLLGSVFVVRIRSVP
jgi:MFS family permease